MLLNHQVKNSTYMEIVNQPTAWAQAIDVVKKNNGSLFSLWSQQIYSQIIFSGCGSTYYLSLAASALAQAQGIGPARGVPAGELVMYPEISYPHAGRTLLVAVSRSAETSETIAAVKAFREKKQGDVLVVTNYEDRILSDLGDVNLIIPEGQEQSVAQTRSFASMYVACVALIQTLGGKNEVLDAMDRLPKAGLELISRYESLSKKWGEDLFIDKFYFLGSGSRYGLACEANLKMKEMSLTHSEPFHFLEFRHGPISMADDHTLVVGLLSDVNREFEMAVLDDAKKLGSNQLTLGEDSADINFSSGLPDAVRNVLYLPALQLMAYYRSCAKGLNPDRPKNITAVVKLNW